MQQRIRELRFSASKSDAKILFITALLVLSMLAVSWVNLPYGDMDRTTLSQSYEIGTSAATATAPTTEVTATAPSAQASESSPMTSSSVGSDKLTARVFLDYACEGSFQNGFDVPMVGVTVELALSDGTSQTRQTTSFGMVYFAGIDLADGATVNVALPEKYRGSYLAPCSPTTVHLPASGLGRGHIRHEHVEFRLHPSVNPMPTDTDDPPPSVNPTVTPELPFLNQGATEEDVSSLVDMGLPRNQAAANTATTMLAPTPTATPAPASESAEAVRSYSREIAQSRVPAVSPTPLPATPSPQLSASPRTTVQTGIGMSRAELQSWFNQTDRDFELVSLYRDESGQPSAVGELEGGSVLIEVVGPSDDLVSVSVTARVPTGGSSTIRSDTGHMLALLGLVLPDWKEGPDWLMTNLSAATQHGEVRTISRGRQVVLQHFRGFGVTALTIEATPIRR